MDDSDGDEFFDAVDAWDAEAAGEPVPVAPPSPSSFLLPRFPLHAAAFSGDLAALDAAIAGTPAGGLSSLDACGNTAVHVAVLRRNAHAVRRLLAAGASPQAKNAAGWQPVYDAAAARDRELVALLHTAAVREQEAATAARKPAIMAALAALPDFKLSLVWELRSPVFAPLLRRFAPSDVYAVTKRGACLRVDGTLKGLAEPDKGEGGPSGGSGSASSILPKWDRGAFSLLFDGATDPRHPTLVVADHDAKTAVDALPAGAARPQCAPSHPSLLTLY